MRINRPAPGHTGTGLSVCRGGILAAAVMTISRLMSGASSRRAVEVCRFIGPGPPIFGTRRLCRTAWRTGKAPDFAPPDFCEAGIAWVKQKLQNMKYIPCKNNISQIKSHRRSRFCDMKHFSQKCFISFGENGQKKVGCARQPIGVWLRFCLRFGCIFGARFLTRLFAAGGAGRLPRPVPQRGDQQPAS